MYILKIKNIKERECDSMKRFEFWLPMVLFSRIKAMAEFYKIPISKMMIKLLEIGYIEYLKFSHGEYHKEDLKSDII